MFEMGADERLQRISEQVAQAQERAGATARLQESVEGLRVEGSSRRQEVEVTIDPAGRLLGVRFLRASDALSAEALSDAVMAAVADARRRAAQQVEALIDQHLGSDPELAEQMRQAYATAAGPGPAAGGGSGQDGTGQPRPPQGPSQPLPDPRAGVPGMFLQPPSR